ncbi:MAG: SPOR domain-containing protein [Candidatus Binatia bacterium]
MRLRHGMAGVGLGQLFALVFGFLVTSAVIFLFGIWVGRDVAERRLVQEERVVRMPIPMRSPGKKAAGGDLAFYEQLQEKARRRLEETAAAAAVSPAVSAAGRADVRRVHPARQPAGRGRSHRATRADGGWTVQVNATVNARQAAALARALRAKGYAAYTVQAPMRGHTWYRVRVGHFSTRAKASELAARLKKVEGMDNAYVTAR